MKVAEVDRWIFSTPIYDMLQRPMIYQAQWVAQYTNLKLRCAKDFKDRNSINLADIMGLLQSKPTGESNTVQGVQHRSGHRSNQRNQKKRVKLKATALVHFFKTTISPTTRLKQDAKLKARQDKRKEDKKRRKSKLREPNKKQSNMHTHYQPQEQRNEDGEVALK
jgi:hypothetical protein